MNNKIVAISIAAVIGIIVLGSVLMPIMNDATAKDGTFTNDGIIRASELSGDTDSTIVWDHTAPNKLTVNGETIEIPSTGAYPVSVAFSDTWMFRMVVGTSISLFTSAAESASLTASTTNGYDMSIVFSTGSVVATANNVSKTNTINGGLMIDPAGDYVLKYASESGYILNDSVVYAAGYTYDGIGSSNALNIFTYTVDDGVTILSTYPPGITHVDTINSTPVNDYKSLTKLDSITMEIASGGITGTVTYNQIFVPAEVTAEKSVHFTDGQNAIFAAIPVMIILAVLLGVVALVIRSRMD